MSVEDVPLYSGLAMAGSGRARAPSVLNDLTLTPDFRSVSTGVYRKRGKGVRGTRFVQGLYRDAYD